MVRAFRRLLSVWLVALTAGIAGAPRASAESALAELAVDDLVSPPFVVGEPAPDLPVRPVLKQVGQDVELAGYVFASEDFVEIPGFSGAPVHLLVAIDVDGRFLAVRVLDHHEPVFLHGLGEAPLNAFVAQYEGESLTRAFKVASSTDRRGDTGGGGPVRLDGVAKATASVRVVNETVAAAALEVARAKLGFAGGGPGFRLREDAFTPLDWDELRARGLVRRLALDAETVAAAFADTPVAGERGGDGPVAELFVAYLNAPMVGRNLLGEAVWRDLMARLPAGDHVLWVGHRGRWGLVADDFIRGTVPERLALRQSGLELELRDWDEPIPAAVAGAPADLAPMTFQVFAKAGLDVGTPFELIFRVTREKGQIYPERFTASFPLAYALAPDLVEPVASDDGPMGWRTVWIDRRGDLAVLGVALAGLTALLAGQHRLTAQPRRFRLVRGAFLAFTLVWVGWIAQAQLSIVTLVGVVRTAVTGGSWTFLLWDPPSLVLWGFVLVTLVVWGRGTFCGWLCPFGVLQGVSAGLGRWLRLPELRVAPRLDAALRSLKYAVLAGLLALAVFAGTAAEKAAEVEPFKTAITLGFDRTWPFVAYAVALLVASAFLHKAFCRYLCPLGAALAATDVLRRLAWLPRRAECGSPCQLCRKRCAYGAIRTDGSIHYRECFQCLDCVAILNDPRTCVPQVLAAKGKRMRAS